MLWRSGWSLLMIVVWAAVRAEDREEEGSSSGDSASRENPGKRSEGELLHHRVARQLLDGFRPSVDGLLALENVDDMLRTTLPTVDRFQCLERLMCSLSSSQPPPTSPQIPTLPIFDPTFQQGIIQDPSTILQGFPGFQQNPALQQGFQQNPALQQGFQQNPAFQNAAIQPPPPAAQFQPPPSGQFGQGSFQTLQAFPGGTGFQNTFPNFRENPESQDQNTLRRESRPPILRRRRPIRRQPQRRGFLDFLSGLGKRKKRSIFDDLLGGFTSDRFLGLLDQTMTQYSFYPYTHAAYMGYTGNPTKCENLYPSCPTTPEEMIDVFNNIHKYFPGGIPFKDKLPWPLNMLLP